MAFIDSNDEDLMEKIICKCKSVSHHEILYSIKHQNATTWGDIQRITGASTGCGRCGVVVQRILKEEIEKQSE